jgi:hypothetical protein
MLVTNPFGRGNKSNLEKELNEALNFLGDEEQKQKYIEWFWSLPIILRESALNVIHEGNAITLKWYAEHAEDIYLRRYAFLYISLIIIIVLFIAYLFLYSSPDTRVLSGICLLIASVLGLFCTILSSVMY